MEPATFWTIFITALFCAFLFAIAIIENVVLKKPLNGIIKMVLLVAVIYGGTKWAQTDLVPKLTTGAESRARGAAPISAWQCPTTHPIKGIFTTRVREPCLFHVPGSALYARTDPRWCYANAKEAMADGCKAAAQ